MAASLVQPMEISREEYDNIFSSSDEEMSNKDSDIDVSGLEDESESDKAVRVDRSSAKHSFGGLYFACWDHV